MNDSDPAAIERFLHAQLPLSAAMGVRVLSAGADGVRLALPLAPNLNNRATAFGGSIASAAILAAWTLIYVRLADAGLPSRVVIQRAVTDYRKPVEGDFEAFSPAPPAEGWDRFAATLRRRGKARIALRSDVLLADGTAVAATFEGDFVAIRQESADARPAASDMLSVS